MSCLAPVSCCTFIDLFVSMEAQQQGSCSPVRARVIFYAPQVAGSNARKENISKEEVGLLGGQLPVAS